MLLEYMTDKDGHPLGDEAQRALTARVRVKRRPGPGASEIVIDPATHEPLVVPTRSTYGEFCKMVGSDPGVYSFNLLDAEHRTIRKDLVGYLTISEPRRNAAPAPEPSNGDSNLVALVRELMRPIIDSQAELVRATADQARANAEMLRAYAAAPLTQRLAAAETAAPAKDDDDNEDEEREPTMVESLIVQGLTACEVWHETRKARIATERAVAPKSVPAAIPVGTATAPRPAMSAAAATPVDVAIVPATAEPAADASVVVDPAPAPVDALGLTAEQRAHMDAILDRLTAREKLQAQAIVIRMKPEVRASWIPEVAALSVEDAVARIREFLPNPSTGGAK